MRGIAIRPRRRIAGLLAGTLASAIVLAGCGSDKSSTTTAAQPSGKDPRSAKLTAAMRASYARYKFRAGVFGVWEGGRAIATGAVGSAFPGQPATTGAHFRIGNTAESVLTNMLLQYVDAGKVSLNDRVSNWYPNLRLADKVTLQMLAQSTSGYPDYVTSKRFSDPYRRNPFKPWTPDQLIAIAVSQPQVFPPGKSWGFSDTNFTLLGQILQKVGGKPLSQLQHDLVFAKLGMANTAGQRTSNVPPPTLHGYETERGVYEDSTNWTPTWVPGVANVTSTLADVGRWSRAMGTGELLSSTSKATLFSNDTAGKGGLPKDVYYAMGFVVSNGWRVANPQLVGYNGIVAYYPPKKLSVVVFTTLGPGSDVNFAYSAAVYQKLAELLTPTSAASVNPCPRGGCSQAS